MPDNRRTATRHEVSLAGQLVVNGEARPVTVVNISLGGALIGPGPKFSMDTRVDISFSIPTTPDLIEVGATVRWSDDKVTGLHFDGLRARDVWALNKFFEQLSQS